MSLIIPEPGSRWRVRDDLSGGGQTLTVERVVRSVIHRPYAEVWIGGEGRRLPLDERWGNGLVPIEKVAA